MTNDHEAIDELLAGYVLRSLSGEDAAEADHLLSDHVPTCATCRDTLSAFQDLSADLALDATPLTPPETLLPRLHRELEPPASRRRPVQIFAVAASVVAVVGLAGLAVTQGLRASDANSRAEDFRSAAQMALRPDSNQVPVGPVNELTAPGVEEFYVMGDNCPQPPEGSVYRVWIVAGGQPTFVTDFLPEDGQVFLSIPFDPSRYDDLWISVEPAGSEPTTPTDVEWQASGSAAAA
ncbi:MAG: anti-sigma factor domain-containing protein [Myxococcota bacterium]